MREHREHVAIPLGKTARGPVVHRHDMLREERHVDVGKKPLTDIVW